MVDLKLEVPATEEVEVDTETLAAIDRGARAADEGRTVSLEEARKMIPKHPRVFLGQLPPNCRGIRKLSSRPCRPLETISLPG